MPPAPAYRPCGASAALASACSRSIRAWTGKRWPSWEYPAGIRGVAACTPPPHSGWLRWRLRSPRAMFRRVGPPRGLPVACKTPRKGWPPTPPAQGRKAWRRAARSESSHAPQPVLAAGDLLNAYAIVAFHDHRLSASDQTAIDQNFHGFVDVAVQLHDGPRRQFKHVPHRQIDFAERDADRKLDIEQQIHGSRARRGWGRITRILHASADFRQLAGRRGNQFQNVWAERQRQRKGSGTGELQRDRGEVAHIRAGRPLGAGAASDFPARYGPDRPSHGRERLSQDFEPGVSSFSRIDGFEPCRFEGQSAGVFPGRADRKST